MLSHFPLPLLPHLLLLVPSFLSPSPLNFSSSISRLLTESIASDSVSMIRDCFECSADDLPSLVARSPVSEYTF